MTYLETPQNAADISHDAFAWIREDDTSVPVLPALAGRVIELTSNPEVTVSQISAVVSKDQVLAARVLQLANSIYSSPLMTISTVAEAIVRLGTTAVRNVVVMVCLTSRMQDPAVYGDRGRALVEHALGTAYLARFAAERARVDLDEAFLYGLLHDIGKLVLMKQAHDYRKRTGHPVPPTHLEIALLERHAAMGSLAMRRWRLPEALDEPVLYHHDPLAAPTRRAEALVAYAANALAHRYGFGCPIVEADVLDDPLMAEIQIDAQWLAAVDTRAPGLIEVARQGLG
jgi:HD-like signal output (HDOD) protein